MLAWFEELITDVRKPEIMVMMSLWCGELFTDYSDHLATCWPLNPNSNQQAPDATSFFPVADAYRKQLGLKDFSPKSQDAVALQYGRSVALYL